MKTPIKLEHIEEYVVLHTNVNTTVKSALGCLEKDGSIAFQGARLRKYTYPEGSIVVFTGKQAKISGLFGGTKSSVNAKRKARPLEDAGERASK